MTVDFIATYWWLWLLGVVAVLGVVVVRTIANYVGFARDAAELAARAQRVAEAAPGERRREITDVALEMAREKLKQRAVKALVNVALLAVGGVFAVLLLIAVVQNSGG